MALQSFAAPSSSGTSQPSGTNFPPPPNNNALTPGSSIPFSFLIAFIALFLFFLGCGLGTRRAAVVFRRNLAMNDPAGSGSRRRAISKPEIWDAWPKVDERYAGGEKWDMLQPLSATYIRAKDGEVEDVPVSPQSLSPDASLPRPMSPLPYGAVRPVNAGLGYFPSRAGGVITIHPPTIMPRSPSAPRLSRAAAPPDMIAGPVRTPTTPAAANAPRVGVVRRVLESLRTNVYVIALLNELGIHPSRRPRNEVYAEPKPVEGLQVSVLLVMPSQERKLRAKLRRESQTSESRQSDPVKGKELLSATSEDPPEISTEFGELVIGTMKIPWDESMFGYGD